MTLALAALLSVVVALLGVRLRALTAAGGALAVLVGVAILHGGGWPGLAALGSFFLGASLISRLAPDRAAALDAKGTTRDPAQVLANGGAAALAAWLLPPGAGLAALTASLAAAAADTWATSLGGYSRTEPRHILRGGPVPHGTSGGVTLLGTLGALVGALSVGLLTALVARAPRLLPIAVGVGVAGMFLDSVLGALVQGRFHCDRCDGPTERRRHRCGAMSRQIGGWRWLDNDGVNGLATLAAALAGWACWHWWPP